MNRNRKLLIGIILMGIVSTSNTWACSQIKRLGGNNVDMTNDSNTLVTLEVKRTQDTITCEYVIGITKGSSQNGTYNRFIQRNQVPIPLRFWDENMTQLLFDYPDATPPSNLIVGSFSVSGGAKKQEETMRLDLGPVPYNIQSGRYFNNFHAQLWTRAVGSTGNFNLANNDNFEVRYDLSKSLDISLVSTGAPFNLVDTSESVDFGEISQNETRSFDIMVGNNTAYSYSLNSTNNGKLLRSGGSIGNSADTISYQFKIGATAYSGQTTLNSGSYPYSTSVMNPPSGSQTRFPVEVKVMESPSGKGQGTYQDTITIDVIAN